MTFLTARLAGASVELLLGTSLGFFRGMRAGPTRLSGGSIVMSHMITTSHD